MLTLLIVVFMAAILAYEAPIIIRERSWRELAVFLVLWASGLIIGILQLLGYPLPNPTVWAIAVMPRIARFAASLLGLD